MKRYLPLYLFGLVCASGTVFAAPQDNKQNRASKINSDQTGVTAISSDTFLGSLGVNTHVSQGYKPEAYVVPLQYLGVRNIRDSNRNASSFFMLHLKTGVKVDLMGADDLQDLVSSAKSLAKADVLLSLEGPNEPNNFPITYKGHEGGGKLSSWIPVADFQKDLYSAVKNDPQLKFYPVFNVSEGGAETDNVGLQFLNVPAGAGISVPDGTQYADYANPHNYVIGNHAAYVDNQAWKAADPTLNSRWDGLYGEYGVTWKMHYKGYSDAELQVLPRVSTETGWNSVSDPGGERVQGTVLVNTYLSQFKRGWRYTFIYELGEGEGGGGNQGLFHKDWTPKLSATYIHNLTTILADIIPVKNPEKLNYSIPNQPDTVHDLLLEKGNGVFELVIWGEQVNGSNDVSVNLKGNHSKVNIYDVTTGVKPVKRLANVSSVSLAVNDHAMILEILP